MNEKWNYADPLDEIYAIRQMISEKYGHDVRRIAAAARERMVRDLASGRRRYVQLPIVRKPFSVERSNNISANRREFATA